MSDNSLKEYPMDEGAFKIFRSRVRHWLDFFGIKDWRVEFVHHDINDSYAECWVNNDGKSATMHFNLKWAAYHEPTDEDLDRTAFHEVWELLLTELEYIARDTDLSSQAKTAAAIRARHRLIRCMENTVFPHLLT